MQITIVARPEAVPTMCVIMDRARLPLLPMFPDSSSPDLQRYFVCQVSDTPEGREMAEWVMEMLREIEGVEGAYIKPRAELADWKVVEEYHTYQPTCDPQE